MGSEDERRQMHELVSYYRVIFTTLAGCASRQLEEVTFRRSAVEVDALFRRAADYHAKRCSGCSDAPALGVTSCEGTLLCDETLADFLLEQLIDAALAISMVDALHLTAQEDGDFIRISLINRSRTLDADTLHTMFYPQQQLIKETGNHMKGVEYIVCRQIIREHDAHFDHIGCRIKAEVCDGGYTVWFTLPLSNR